MNDTPELLKQLFPNYKKPVELSNTLNNVLPKYEITTCNRIAGFLAQCGHESLGFTILRENLNYSAQGLLKIFPKYFNKAQADLFQRQPEKIANRVYANRMGNGSDLTGDGWKFRGTGPLQLTGKNNFTAFGNSIGKTVDDVAVYAATLQGGIESACWYWKTNNLNKQCDEDDIDGMSDLVNKGRETAAYGDAIGFDDRNRIYNLAKSLLGGTPIYETVKLGSNNNTVKLIQEKLGLLADGDFGPKTEAAVKKWQAEHGLVADGVVGPVTLSKMLG